MAGLMKIQDAAEWLVLALLAACFTAAQAAELLGRA
jgi:hypothetical protein